VEKKVGGSELAFVIYMSEIVFDAADDQDRKKSGFKKVKYTPKVFDLIIELLQEHLRAEFTEFLCRCQSHRARESFSVQYVRPSLLPSDQPRTNKLYYSSSISPSSLPE
jgi:hypothetical protein